MQLNIILLSICSILGQAIPDQYIIKFNNNINSKIASPAQAITQILNQRSSGDNKVLHIYKSAINGMAVKADHNALNSIKELRDIRSIEPVNIVEAYSIQKDAPWGLARISQRNKLAYPPFDYNYDEKAGRGVNIYIVDTGININHVDFEGRAKWGITTASNSSDEDLSGHGTHCAGTAASKTYGVAKKANLIAVKVLSDNGSGTTADIIAGIDWVINHNSGYNSKVMSMSLGSQIPATWANEAVENAVKNGVVTVVAAGNSNDDACKYSPAGAPSAITVANSDINDAKRNTSNYVRCIDVIAPGTNILSTFIGSNTATRTATGTSMSCPHIAGLAATLLSLGTASKDIDSKIKSLATRDKITGFSADTPNLLAYNGYKKY